MSFPPRMVPDLLSGNVNLLRVSESLFLPLGCVYRPENPGRLPLDLIEVQSGAYLGTDDIVRLEYAYARE